MTRDELIEKVAAQISTASFVRFTPGTYAIAEATIDVVLEEAARIADAEKYDFPPDELTDYCMGYNSGSRDAGRKIRALKSGGENE